MYEIRFTGAAEKYLKKVKKKALKKAFQNALGEIRNDPYFAFILPYGYLSILPYP